MLPTLFFAAIASFSGLFSAAGTPHLRSLPTSPLAEIKAAQAFSPADTSSTCGVFPGSKTRIPFDRIIHLKTEIGNITTHLDPKTLEADAMEIIIQLVHNKLRSVRCVNEATYIGCAIIDSHIKVFGDVTEISPQINLRTYISRQKITHIYFTDINHEDFSGVFITCSGKEILGLDPHFQIRKFAVNRIEYERSSI